MFEIILIILSQIGLNPLSDAETNGKLFHKPMIKEKRIILPDNFNPEKAKEELLKARKTGNKELFSRLSSYLHEWWKRNREISRFTLSAGNKTIPSYPLSSEENVNVFSESTKWGNDVRMDSRDSIYNVKITSLSNGELYAIAILEDSIKVILMSKDNGETWKIKYEYNFGGNYKLLSPGIMTVNDTLVEWYVIHYISSNTYYGWVKVTLPDSGDFPIYWGSPTGTNQYYVYSLHLASDAPVYGSTRNLYATWIEKDFGESWSRIMFSRSDELDVSAWEIGPINLYSTSGVGPYWLMTRIAYGQPDKLWIAVILHSWGYFPNAILGCFSDDFGATWSNIWLRESGETYADISASYKDSNWVIIFGRGPDRLTTTDLYVLYSTDGGLNWTEEIWDTSGTQNFLADVFIDDSSTSFFAVYRKNYNIYKELRVKIGDINNPASWTAGDVVNEDNTRNLSDIHIPSIGFNYLTQEPVVTWTDFSNNIYSIWFDALSRVRISEDRRNINKNLSVFINGKNSAKILLTLTSFSRVKLNLFSTSGRKVKEIFDGGLTPGTHSFKVKMPVSGKYFLKIKTKEGEDTEPVILIK